MLFNINTNGITKELANNGLFVEMAKPELIIKDHNDKVFIKSSYFGLTTTAVVDKITLNSEDDNVDTEFIMQFMKNAKSGTITIDSNIGEIDVTAKSKCVFFINSNKINACMEFKNINGKKMFFALVDRVRGKISEEELIHYMEVYYNSIH